MDQTKNNKLKEYVLELITKHSFPLTLNTISNKIKGVSKYKINKMISELCEDSKIVISKKGKIILMKSSEHVVSEIVSQSKNFMFAKSLIGDQEFFISKCNTKSALIGDKVIIKEIHDSEKGLNGKVKEIIEPGQRIVTGKVLKSGKTLELLCDSAIRYNIPIPPRYSNCAKQGDKVQVCLLKQPSGGDLLAKVTKIYGKSTNAKVCVDALLDMKRIPINFSPKLMKQAQAVGNSKISEEDINSRLDLRQEIIFTIDGEDAKDLDDAISIKKLSNGWELGVHIADVSHYINENTLLDQEAYSRGTSIYLADRVIPMIPEPISNGVCSLNPHQDKLTFSAIMNLDQSGEVKSSKFVDSIINSSVRGEYSEINCILQGENRTDLQNKYFSVINSINLAKELSDILSERSRRRGSIEISSEEPKFTINQDNRCINVETRKQGLAENIIENFMITANCAAAHLAKQKGLPFVYRTHSKPENKKIGDLSKLSDMLGINSQKIRPGITSKDISELLKSLKHLPSYKIIARKVLQTMAKAQYSPEPTGHFGLCLEDYCHFTSPIRRYPDIYVHRILKSLQNKDTNKPKNKNYPNNVEKISRQSTMCEIQAMKLERETDKHFMAEFMSPKVGKTYTGIIDGINAKGIFVSLENSISGFLDISYYKEYNFIFDGFTCHYDKRNNKKISIGDPIKVKVSSVDISLGTIDFIPDENN